MTGDRFGRVLFAWIPDGFINIVDNAIAVNALEVFKWYDGGMDALIEERKLLNNWRDSNIHTQTIIEKTNVPLSWWGKIISYIQTYFITTS